MGYTNRYIAQSCVENRRVALSHTIDIAEVIMPSPRSRDARVLPFGQAAAIIGISKRTLEKLLERGADVPRPFWVGRRRLYLESTLHCWLEKKAADAQLPSRNPRNVEA